MSDCDVSKMEEYMAQSEPDYVDTSDYPNDVYASLFYFQDLQEACSEMMGFSGIKMKQDFGPLKKDETYPTIWFFPEKGLVEVHPEEGNIPLHSFKYKLSAE